MIVKLAEAGEVLGLSATISGKPYEVTAETIDPCQVTFVKREDFLLFLKDDVEACFKVRSSWARSIQCCKEVRSLGLSHSAAEKTGDVASGMEFEKREFGKAEPRLKLD